MLRCRGEPPDDTKTVGQQKTFVQTVRLAVDQFGEDIDGFVVPADRAKHQGHVSTRLGMIGFDHQRFAIQHQRLLELAFRCEQIR